MAARRWRTGRPLEDDLFREPYRFDFLQAVRLLERRRPQAAPVGEGTEPAREAVRFHSDAGLHFPASEIAALAPGRRETQPADMTVTFLGLAGNAGPLPASIAELIHARASKRDHGLKDFLDIFTHRLVSLLVRGRKKHRVGLDDRPPERTHFADYLFALLGLGTDGLKGRMRVPDRALLMFAALAHQRPRSMAGLEILLGEYFEVRVKGRQFVRHWLDIAEDEWTVVGGAKGLNNALGRGAVIGTRASASIDAFELRLGPLGLGRFMSFLPIGDAWPALVDLTRFYAGVGADFFVRLEIAAAEVPPLRLSVAGRSYLGWTTWLKARPFARDDAQVRLRPGGVE